MEFDEMQAEFESRAGDIFQLELLTKDSVPNGYRSGELNYKIYGFNVKLHYDGRDDLLSLYVTENPINVPFEEWEQIYVHKPKKFFEVGIVKLAERIGH